jgi:hypothetical protein
MTLETAMKRDSRIRATLGDGWQMNCIKLPDDSNVNATWTRGKCHISCSLYDDTDFHFSVSLGEAISFQATHKHPHMAACIALRKAGDRLARWQADLNTINQDF